jgi:hypothetical protein
VRLGIVIRIDCGLGSRCKGAVQEELSWLGNCPGFIPLVWDGQVLSQAEVVRTVIWYAFAHSWGFLGRVRARRGWWVCWLAYVEGRGRRVQDGRTYERVSVGLFISRHGMTMPSDGVCAGHRGYPEW